jgi:hypothetical protein
LKPGQKQPGKSPQAISEPGAEYSRMASIWPGLRRSGVIIKEEF